MSESAKTQTFKVRASSFFAGPEHRAPLLEVQVSPNCRPRPMNCTLSSPAGGFCTDSSAHVVQASDGGCYVCCSVCGTRTGTRHSWYERSCRNTCKDAQPVLSIVQQSSGSSRPIVQRARQRAAPNKGLRTDVVCCSV